MNGNYEIHKFFCIQCGNEGIPIMRKRSHQYSKLHRKKLYCPHCRTFINHIECKNQEDVEDFKNKFNEGFYAKEVNESVLCCN